MKNISEKELELLNHLWNLKEGFLKEIIDCYEVNKPAYTTVSTMLNRLIAKDIVGFKTYGRDKKYYPLVKKQTYFKRQFNQTMNRFFNNSPSQFASFFTKESDLTLEQLEELRLLVDNEITKRKK
jgi:predicted transcriptional regulator